jgi:hypothetical protein
MGNRKTGLLAGQEKVDCFIQTSGRPPVFFIHLVLDTWSISYRSLSGALPRSMLDSVRILL